MRLSEPAPTQSGAPIQRFTTHAFQWPLNLGRQAPYWQDGGPRTGNTLGAVHPWPYMTGCKQFICGFPYGAASTLVSKPNGPNLGTGAVNFIPIGYTKPQTYAGVAF